MGGERTKLTLRPPEEYDTEDTKEIEVDDLDMAEVLKLAQNEGLDPTAVEVGIRKEMKGLQDFGVYQEICKIPSVCRHLFPESTFDSKLVLVLLSFVSGRLVELVSGHPRPSSVEALVYRGCPLPGTTSVPQSPRWLCGKAPTLLSVGWSRDIVCSVRSCSWSCFTLMCN